MFAPTYLDWNASTPLHPAALEAMLPWLGQRYGNASSRHDYGRQARAAIDEARGRVAAAVGAHASEVVFTSGGSESNNSFVKGAAGFLKPSMIAISAIEHPCVREPALQLRRAGWSVREVTVDHDGLIDAQDWQQVLNDKPAIVSIMLANNESGVVQDIATLAAQAKRAGALIHTDAVQALGKLPLDFRALGVHGMSLSAHKIGGPIGAGALVLDKRVELLPVIAGGGQERGLRSGTENVAAIVGFGVAAELAAGSVVRHRARLAALRDFLEVQLRTRGATVFSIGAARLPNTSFFAVPGLDGETLVGKLDRAGFACASGSACSSANPEPSHTLLAMGVARDVARSAVRVSLGHATNEQDVQNFVAAFDAVTGDLKKQAAMAATV